MQKPRTHRRHGAIDRREQRAIAGVVAERTDQFEASPRDFVENEKFVGAVRANPANVREARLQRFVQVNDDRTRRYEARLRIVEAEPGHRRHLELFVKGFAGRGRIEIPIGPRRDAFRHVAVERRANRVEVGLGQ